MSYNVTKSTFVKRENGKPIYRIEAILDAESDLEALGADYAPGSVAMVADTGAPVYMMNASGQWKKI